MKTKEQLKKLINALSDGLYEREEALRLALLSAMAGESLFMLGLPGVAKSLVARRLKCAFQEGQAFEYLMSRFSTPDELFGPVAISKLKDADCYERKVEGYLPTATIVFLDEIWKAGPSIQNALLTVLNEKIYRNGDKELKLPLKGIISASNELPAPSEGLEALWDRFLVRLLIEGVQDRAKFEKMICVPSTRMHTQPASKLLITEQDYQEYSQLIDEVAVPDSVLDIIHTVRTALAKQNKLWSDQAQGVATIYVSDRRWRKIVRLLRCSALLNDRLEVCPMDCFLMQHCLWDSPEQIGTVQRIVTEAIRKHGTRIALDLGEIKGELKRLDNDIREETKGMKKQLFFKTHNLPNESGNFYRLDSKDTKTPFYIKLADYNKLKKASKKGISCQLFYKDPFYSGYTRSAYDVTYLEEGKLQLNGSSVALLETEEREVEEPYVRQPRKRAIEEWDKQCVQLNEELAKSRTVLEKEIADAQQQLRSHLFVSARLAPELEQAMQLQLRELGSLETELKRIKSTYKGS